MKLENDKLVIESRYEIDDLMNMIDAYLKSNPKMQSVTVEELEKIKNQLDVLFLSW